MSQDLPLLRWLHLTDLHIGKASEPQKIAMQSLFKAVIEEARGVAFDLVILTGDLVYAGQKDEFARLSTLLIEPLKAHHLFKDATFVAVPGNHDLDCDVALPISWAGLGKIRQEDFFNFDSRGIKLRSTRAAAFGSYAEFVKGKEIASVNPLVSPAQLHSIDVRGRKFGIVCLVTAFFSDKEKELTDKHRAPIPVQPVRAVLQDLERDTVPIILGHHPIGWFTPDSAEHFNSLLVDERALYLHGHEHSIISKFGNRGLTSLGFGAAYQSNQENASPSFYRNSFAVCELWDDLHVSVTSWDADNGKWRSDQKLPADFYEQSTRLVGGYALSLPTTRLTNHAAAPISMLASALRGDAHINNCIWLARDEAKRWTELMISMGKFSAHAKHYKLAHQMLPVGHVQFRVIDSRAQYLVHAISPNGDVMNQDQVEKINTLLDTEDYDGCFIVTLGSLAKEAKTLAGQLAHRKPITVLERGDIVKQAIRALSAAHSAALSKIDPDKVSTSLVITDSGLALLCEDKTRNTWFNVVDESGKQSAESSSLVCKLREGNASLSRLAYESADVYISVAGAPLVTPVKFDRKEYLRRSHEYFDDVKYAPLAALGLRFKKTSLSEMYVTASADVGGTTKTSQNATRAVVEYVESLGLPKAQQELLESQIRARYGLESTAEVGAASQLYQRYNNIVVLGDPGSGKTCFVKHEMLSYCTAGDTESWYSQHIPVYVSLAEASKLSGDNVDMLEICHIQSARRGIDLPKEELEKALSDGRAAFFFDGLDEVGYIDKRINLMSEIGRLVKNYANRGNRFVLASRPAAVQPVDVPDAFTYVQLKGLSEDEMRVLAARVMTARLGDSEEQLLESEESDLIERLLDDTRNSPGIARIARNPLLLTLLVLIYANTGAVSAKRHLIYSQAIKTLVSVRGRDLREQQISEADLRTRLGALAVGIFKRDIDEIPKRADVVGILSPIIARSRNINVQDAAPQTNAFLQEVAEATGLLSIHPDAAENRGEDLITFMHYSFLEYYTAAGLLSGDYSEVLSRLSRNPRWKDVTTLMFGILSDHSDVTGQLQNLLKDETSAGAITKYKLLLGMDCASECDVPPEGAQDLLAEEIYRTVAHGAGRYSPELRGEIAERLRYFLQGAGPRIEVALVRGLRDPDPIAKAAFCDLLSRIDPSIKLPVAVAMAFSDCLAETHPAVQTAAMLAIETHAALRGEKTIDVIGAALKGSISEKHAALKVVSAIPEFHAPLADKIRPLLDDHNVLISELAANCMLAYGLRDEHEAEGLREKVLSKLNQSEHSTSISRAFVTIDQATLDSMIADQSAAVRELAIRYVPLVTNDARYIHRTLSRLLRTETMPRIQGAILDSFRGVSGAVDLITIADTDLVCGKLKARERNVRLAAIKLLGELPDDEKVILSLKGLLDDLTSDSTRDSEVSEAARALAQHVRRNPRLRDDILKTVLQYIPSSVEEGFGDNARQHHIRELLYVCESIGGIDEKTAQQVLRFAEDFRTPEKIRVQAIRVFGRLAEPNAENARRLCTQLNKNDFRLREAVYAASTAFIKRCRAKVQYVRRVNVELDTLRDCLADAWRRETGGSGQGIAPSGATDIREAIVEIENLTAAYEEFAELAHVKNSTEV
jgi:predicted MPP superfamily phosphohydrolase